MVDLPKYISPTERGYKEYISAVKQFNASFQARLKQSLGAVICESSPHFGVYTTGSDGRLEKGPVSKLEFVLVNDGRLQDEQVSMVLNGLKHYRPSLTAEDLEIKNLAKDVMSQYHNDPNKTFPMRILDLAYLAGNKNLETVSKIRLLQEWKGKKGKKVLKRVNDKRMEYKKITQTGKQRFRGEEITHFDLESGQTFYDPENGLLSKLFSLEI